MVGLVLSQYKYIPNIYIGILGRERVLFDSIRIDSIRFDSMGDGIALLVLECYSLLCFPIVLFAPIFGEICRERREIRAHWAHVLTC